MPVTLPECAGMDHYPLESGDTCPTFLGCLIGDGDRLSPFVPDHYCCRIAWWNCHYGNDGGYYTRWERTIDDPIMRTYYTLSEEPCTA